MSPLIYTLYPHVRQFETNDLLAQQLADLRVVRRRRGGGARRSRRRWLVLAAAILVVATVTIYAAML